MKKTIRYIGPWRRRFQWLISLLILIIPFIRIDGRSLLYFDIPGRTIHFATLTFSIEELYLFWLLAVSMVFLFLIITMILGRVWCGWACPQTTLTDLTEELARIIGLQVTNGIIRGTADRKIIWYIFILLLALLVGANLVWYFVPPAAFFPQLFNGNLGPWPVGALLTVGLLVFLDQLFLRRLLCREFCPYGRFQSVLLDRGTLNLRYKTEEDDRCIHCRACIRACPMGIDIKDGYQIECINCARCLDACRAVLGRKGGNGLITYSFGTSGKGWRALLSPRLALICLVFLLLSTGLFFSAVNRPVLSLKLARIPQIKVRQLDDGSAAIMYTAFLTNRSTSSRTVTLAGKTEDGGTVRLMGPTKNILLDNGEKKQFTFAVLSDHHSGDRTRTVTISVLDAKQTEIVAARILLPPSQPERRE